MSKPLQVTDTNSFRIPNSIVQGLTTSTAADLNRLTAFQMVTLFGLLKHVDPKNPGREVRTKPSKILEIIEVSRQVAHAIERGREAADGEIEVQEYVYKRYSPWHMQQVHQALLALHQQTVVVRSNGGKEARSVHILDSFGYAYERNGMPLDLDDLPPDAERKNVGSAERPVWRVAIRKSDEESYDRPIGILFRLNTELANELSGKRHKDSIGFTLVAGKVFGLLREFMHQPWAIRLIMGILRQVRKDFTRKLGRLIGDLGLDQEHHQRSIEQLTGALSRLREVGIVTEFKIDTQANRLRVTTNRNWYREAGNDDGRQGT